MTTMVAESSAGRATLDAAEKVCELLARCDKAARREHRTLPTAAERNSLHVEFWGSLVPALATAERALDHRELLDTKAEVRTALNGWLLRSRFWARSYLKPHGYAGDFRMVEWMYDLESDNCADPTQPAVLNLIDGLGRSVHSVQAVWHRRRWFASVILGAVASGVGQVRVLDIACGGSRYVRDVLESYGLETLKTTFVDQDAGALCYVRSWLAPISAAQSRLICAPIQRLAESLLDQAAGTDQFDVTISTGLFDYLDEDSARRLLSLMCLVTRPGGIVAICNFAPDDASRLVKDWVSDWQLIYRTRLELAELFSPLYPVIEQSPDGGLLYARAVLPESDS